MFQQVSNLTGIYALILTVLVAAWSDWNTFKIPNALIAASGTAAVMLAGFSPDGIGLGKSFLGGLIGLGMFLPVYMARGMAAGDVKLMAVIGMHIGPVEVVSICLSSCLIGGAWALVVMDLRRGTGLFSWIYNQWRAKTNSQDLDVMMTTTDDTKANRLFLFIPYGVVIAIGTLAWIVIVYMTI